VSAYSFEAFTLLAEGVSPSLIDNAALLFGMPIGPMALADSIGLPLLVDVAASMKGDGNRTGMKGIRAAEALDKLVGGLGRKGKAGGAGVYDYPAEGKTAWDGLAAIFPPPAVQPSVEEVQRRLMDSMSLEAVRTLEDGVLDAPIDGDVAAHLGLGYPAQKGGPFAHIDDVGLAAFAARCDEMAERVGGRFEVPGLLRQMASAGRKFHDV
jgi:3-hydroxyacyl-CoA dehydrogenase/enoyl-CoA hydratase/3-hydroxybutyryl-CoA epimerase